MTLAISAGLLMAGGVYLMMQRDMLRIALGFTLLGHAANLIIMAAGGTGWREQPIGEFDAETLGPVADPVPQAFVLTAIVISFAISILMFVTAAVGKEDDYTRPGLDPLEEDPADRELGTSVGEESEELRAAITAENSNDRGVSFEEMDQEPQERERN